MTNNKIRDKKQHPFKNPWFKIMKINICLFSTESKGYKLELLLVEIYNSLMVKEKN